MAVDRTVCLIAGMLSQPIPTSLGIYSSFELRKMDANIAALAMVLRLDLVSVTTAGTAPTL
ncbi:hypothetical protein R20943_01234 [Paraburkholderia aspalathi]|nr:hypothetical protein R20943_01234 [Paraburkholderia aspalathi]